MDAKTKPDPDGMWWCNAHKREATHVRNGRPCCDPKLGGILLPCMVVFVPMKGDELSARMIWESDDD